MLLREGLLPLVCLAAVFAYSDTNDLVLNEEIGEVPDGQVGVTSLNPFLDGFNIAEFVDGDPVLEFLNDGYDILKPGNDPSYRAKFKDFTTGLIQSRDQLELATFQALESEIMKLNDGLEEIYQRLLHLSRVLVSLTPNEMLEMADILIANQDYYNQVMDFNNLAVPGILSKRFEEVSDVVDSDNVLNPDQPLADSDLLPATLENSETIVSPEQQFKEYWDPDKDYEILQDFLLEDVSSLTPNDKLNDIVQAAGILKKIVHKVEDKVDQLKLIYKVYKLKKILKSKSSVAIFALIKTIEKIKRIIRHIKHCIIKHIKKFIKNFPFNVLWRLKILIKLIIKILLQILWEVRYLLTEILYKLYFLAKRLKKIPIAIILYLKNLSDKESWFEKFDDDDDDDDYWGEWDAWKEYDNVWDDDEEWEEKNFIKYQLVSSYKVPKEIDEIYDGFFDQSDLKEINKDSFNFDIEYDFNEDIDTKLDLVDLQKRSKVGVMINSTTATSISGIGSTGNHTINISFPSNQTSYDSRGSTLGSQIVGPYVVGILLVVLTRFVLRSL